MRNACIITGNTMPEINVFLDSSALIAGIISEKGASRALLLLGEEKKITLTVTEQVIAEVERSIARKAPKALTFARQTLLSANLHILHDPPAKELEKFRNWISHPADLPILVAASKAKVGFSATLNMKHFMSDPEVSHRSGIRIGTPGDALAWVRRCLVE